MVEARQALWRRREKTAAGGHEAVAACTCSRTLVRLVVLNSLPAYTCACTCKNSSTVR